MFSCHRGKRFEKHLANSLSQLIINVKTTLGYRRWGNINLSIVFHGSSANIEAMPINLCRLKQTTQTSKFKQRWWTLKTNVISTLIWCWSVYWVFFYFPLQILCNIPCHMILYPFFSSFILYIIPRYLSIAHM